MKELLELKEKLQKEVSDLYQTLQYRKEVYCTDQYRAETKNLNDKYQNKLDILQLIEIIYPIIK